MRNKPIVLTVFANDHEDVASYLRELRVEKIAVQEALESSKLFEEKPLANGTIDSIKNRFETYKEDIKIFHYGGHGASDRLLLESSTGGNETIHGEGLAAFLAGQKGLKLIFLNACNTHGFVKKLIEGGTNAALIATHESIDDRFASQLAKYFYEGLGKGVGLEQAWSNAVNCAKAKFDTLFFRKDLETDALHQKQKDLGKMRSLMFEGAEEKPSETLPWALYLPESFAWEADEKGKQEKLGIKPEDVKRKQLIDLLNEAYDNEGIEMLCFSYEEFKPVADNMTSAQNKNIKILSLIKHCEQHLLKDFLLEKIKEERPAAYQKHLS